MGMVWVAVLVFHGADAVAVAAVALILITFTLLRCIISNHPHFYQQHGKAKSTQGATR